MVVGLAYTPRQRSGVGARVRTRLRKRAGRLRTTLPEARSARATVDRCGAPLEQTRSKSRARRRPRRRVPCRHGRSGPLPAPGRGGVLTSRRAPLATSNVQGLRRPRLQPRREHAGLAEEPQMTLLDLLEVLAGDHTEGQPDELDELLAEGRERAYLTTQSLNEARAIRVPVHVVDRMNVCDTCKSRVALGRRTQQRLRRGDRGRDHDAVWPHPRRDRGDDSCWSRTRGSSSPTGHAISPRQTVALQPNSPAERPPLHTSATHHRTVALGRPQPTCKM